MPFALKHASCGGAKKRTIQHEGATSTAKRAPVKTPNVNALVLCKCFIRNNQSRAPAPLRTRSRWRLYRAHTVGLTICLPSLRWTSWSTELPSEPPMSGGNLMMMMALGFGKYKWRAVRCKFERDARVRRFYVCSGCACACIRVCACVCARDVGANC